MDYYEQSVPEFDLKNPELSWLASEAALDISNFGVGEKYEVKAPGHLAKLLGNLKENPRVDVGTTLALAISGRENFRDYWNKIPSQNHMKHLAIRINRVSKNLRCFKTLSKDKLNELTDFCVNLSRECGIHYQTYYSGHSRLAG